ncbi:hypothetical protein DYB37_011429 [Aphanomyces astaci]|uniref:Uncharacterized protein n=1 Tax=Aphanomyces astaci TaxID=112090 RepID=A0A397CZA3_APHAT|nr:hypothetical protein DYB25_005257 [Aphanomyces astaci]RHY55007.1 hypothetical protein DYB38_004029 [Aphanomyces astaci]RHY99082.1 hypothetical protein DYB35_008118 [Aphanomyces astaci]RHZ27893.1 hypothetical protein DYB37_011429 [Aphanomyces astaci]RHZ41805.1 hypothetical protein DYB26_006015 [Aphanomyces astaci]
MQWAATTTLKPAARNYGTLQPIPEEDHELSPMLRANYMSPALRKLSFRRQDSMPYAMKNGSTTLNPRALVYVISVPAVLFLFFMFIFILRANAPATDILWRDCAFEPWQTSDACDSTHALAYRASSIVANLTWEEKLSQCRVVQNELPQMNLSTFNYCQEAKFKKLLQVHPVEFAPIDMTSSCEHYYLRGPQPPRRTLNATDCKAGTTSSHVLAGPDDSWTSYVAVHDLILNGVLLSLSREDVATCSGFHYTSTDVSTLNDVLMRLLAGRILADETQEVTADGIELGAPEDFHAGPNTAGGVTL